MRKTHTYTMRLITLHTHTHMYVYDIYTFKLNFSHIQCVFRYYYTNAQQGYCICRFVVLCIKSIGTPAKGRYCARPIFSHHVTRVIYAPEIFWYSILPQTMLIRFGFLLHIIFSVIFLLSTGVNRYRWYRSSAKTGEICKSESIDDKRITWPISPTTMHYIQPTRTVNKSSAKCPLYN